MQENLENFTEEKKTLSIKRQVSTVLFIVMLLIMCINLSMFYSIDRKLVGFDNVYASNEFNATFLEELSLVQTYMKAYMLTKDTTALSDYYVHVEILRNMCNSIEYSTNNANVLVMQHDIVELTDNYLNVASNAMQNKRGRNILKYREYFENATALYNYLGDYIRSLNGMQFSQNTANYDNVKFQLKSLELFCMVIIIIAGMAESVLARYMANRITEPLIRLTESAKEVADGKLNVELDVETNTTEVRILTDAFSIMVVNLKKYIEQEKKTIEARRDIRERELQMKAKVKDAELKYYQSQMDPHFLFNTLNAGVQLAMLESASRTSEYIGNVAQFFRYNLKKDNGVTTIADEIKLIDYYMAILGVRFGGDIKLHKEIDESLCEIELPKMTIQPIIENSVNHGLGDMEDGGNIYLSVYREGDLVFISVADDGEGMDADSIKAVLNGTYVRKKQSDSSNGVGVHNIISRLKMFYNRDDVMDFISEGPGCGLEVIIKIPYQKNES